MKVKDSHCGHYVDVAYKECPGRSCYWPRPDPGVFTQGIGYRTRNPGKPVEWLCGTRNIHGCPQNNYRSLRRSDDPLLLP
jgi:hypothetical protein